MIETRDTHEDGSLDNRFFASVLFISRVTPDGGSALTSTPRLVPYQRHEFLLIMLG